MPCSWYVVVYIFCFVFFFCVLQIKWLKKYTYFLFVYSIWHTLNTNNTAHTERRRSKKKPNMKREKKTDPNRIVVYWIFTRLFRFNAIDFELFEDTTKKKQIFFYIQVNELNVKLEFMRSQFEFNRTFYRFHFISIVPPFSVTYTHTHTLDLAGFSILCQKKKHQQQQNMRCILH